MYDMYPWDSASQGDYPPEPLRSRRDPKSSPKSGAKSGPKSSPEPSARYSSRSSAEPGPGPFPAAPARAVQIALDRRDNGGDAAPATLPTASLTRQ